MLKVTILRNRSCTITINSVLWMLMTWCFSTRASATTILTHTWLYIKKFQTINGLNRQNWNTFQNCDAHICECPHLYILRPGHSVYTGTYKTQEPGCYKFLVYNIQAILCNTDIHTHAIAVMLVYQGSKFHCISIYTLGHPAPPKSIHCQQTHYHNRVAENIDQIASNCYKMRFCLKANFLSHILMA